MFTANPDLELFANLAAFLSGYLEKVPHALGVEYGERVRGPDLLLDVGVDDLAAVVAREPERGLRQIVGAEAEELSLLGDFASRQRRRRQLNHGAHQVLNGDTLLL